MRKLLLFFAMLCVSIGTWADSLSGGGSYTVADGVVTFSNTNAGAIAAESSFNFSDGTRIKFDKTCSINQADLEKFLQGNKYYVDLFDITNGTDTPMKIDDYTTENDDNNANNIDKIIEKAVAHMVTENWQAKGIILPLNTGSGTTKVETAINQESKPTFTEYAAYYRQNTDPHTVAIYAHSDEMKGDAWKNVTSHAVAQGHYSTAYSHLTTHTEVESATTYIVSTNSRINNSDEPLNLENINKSGVTKISIVNDELVYKDSSRSLLAFISVEGATGGDFAAAVQNTNINGTPCEELTVRGQVNSADIAAVNKFNNTETTADKVGPKVYNLANASVVQKTDLKSITNPHIELIILPSTLAEQELGKDDFSTALTAETNSNFKSAIATSTDKTKLSAYVNVPGSLAQARCFATGNSSGNAGEYYPKKTDLTSVILGGNLNANDIGTKNNGDALQNESSITSIDLAKAYFATASDMRLGTNGGANLTSLTSVKLPTDSRMTEIPEQCLYDLGNLQNLHIPYNYKKIRAEAFFQSNITHITTEDANHVLIDNGPNTYTLSGNIDELGKSGQNNSVFPQNKAITDVYCLAMQAPLCYVKTFPLNSTYNNSEIYDGPFCRDKYIKYENGIPTKAMTILHFPSQESYKIATGDNTDAGYNAMQSKYTDPSRVYAKKDQTGAVDANGKAFTWPDQGEANLTHQSLATKGYLWTNYPNKTYVTSGDGHLESLGNLVGGTADFYPNYVGWHEFVLAAATYVDPAEKKESEKIVREYEETGYYTFCIPFNMSYKQVVEMLGVPKSTDKVINKLNGKAVDKDYMPEIRQLSSVTRKKGENGKSNIVMLRMTNNLWEAVTSGYTAYLQITHNPNSVTTQLVNADPYNSSSTIDDRLSLIGGRPYIIKAYKRKQLDANGNDLFKIKKQNLGLYVMEHYGDQFGVESSIVQNKNYESYLCYEQLKNNKNEEKTTLRFAKPFENHRVQATRDGDKSAYLTYETTEGGETVTKKYYYTMVGQFWQQPLPQYCLYMSRGNWYRYSNVPENIDDRYTWDPYKCVIMATEEIAGTKGNGYRNETASVYPKVIGETDDKLDGVFSLTFLDGRNDDDFGETGTSAKYIFSFDDEGIIELDEDGNEVTAIKQLDGEMVATPVNTKVYNMAGQYVGNSLQGLSKGLYIVNGKKIIVK